MRPSARIAALVELVSEIEEGIAAGGAPADSIVNQYFRARRYAGSKDRRAISDMVYEVLRQRELLLWMLSDQVSARGLVIAYLLLNDEQSLTLFEETGQFAPDALSDSEVDLIEKLKSINALEAPATVKHNMPLWALGQLKKRFGSTLYDAADAMNKAAPVDLRPNLLKVDDKFISDFLDKSEGFEATKLSPFGVRSQKNIGLGGIPEYKQGKLEVQDEAAQVASLLVDAKPGMQVADICAGAGGKTLLVSCQMANKGQVYAYDTSGKRLTECKKRIERGGNRNVQVTQLKLDSVSRSKVFEPVLGKCDRVYVDVPCSGSGTWRRSPDQRWRMNEAKLAKLNDTQFALLTEASALVKAGGRLLYMTCSVLPSENEAIVERFINTSSDNWRLVNYKDIWSETIGTECPHTNSSVDEALQLVPHVHHTDGFFVAVLERQ
ncbi:MAG: RsmB/NOP family class I SAM-dependent RNA methyltransferase [Kordiimonas sp.]